MKEVPEETRKRLAGKGFFPQEGFILQYLPVPPNCLYVPEISDGKSIMSSVGSWVITSTSPSLLWYVDDVFIFESPCAEGLCYWSCSYLLYRTYPSPCLKEFLTRTNSSRGQGLGSPILSPMKLSPMICSHQLHNICILGVPPR